VVDIRALLAPDTAARLGGSRARVLDLLRAAGGPLGVQEIASQAGLHPNTARFHLDALVHSGLASRERQQRESLGRPSMAYAATGEHGPAGQRRYRLLAEMLSSMLAEVMPQPGEAAAEAGREWGRYLAGQLPPYERLDAAQATERLEAILENIGFAPELTAEGGGYRLLLRQCPFREVAERHQDVVCALHLGLMQGALAQMRTPVSAGRLQPFAETSGCTAELAVDQGSGDSGLSGEAVVARLVGGRRAGRGALPAAAHATTLVFGKPAPDPVVLAGAQRELQARLPHRAPGAHLFGLRYLRQRGARRAGREEQLRVLAAAGRVTTPAALVPARTIRPEGRSLRVVHGHPPVYRNVDTFY
jgi:predicted ArsR family transcriptional regulator